MAARYPGFSITPDAQLASEVLFGGLAVVTLVYCLRLAVRRSEAWPLAVFGGSMLLVTYEPLNNLLANCAYPTGPGHHQMLGYLGQHVPYSTWLIYMFYFSFAVPNLMQRLEAGMTPRAFFSYYAIVALLCAAFEPLFAGSTGLHWWKYYGPNQALDFTGMPMFWWFANSMVVVGMAATFHLLRKHVFGRNWQTLLFVPLAPLILFALHGSAAAPVFVTIASTQSKALSTAATLATIAISILYVWIFGRAVCTPSTQPPTDAVAVRGRAEGGPLGRVSVPTSR